MVEANLEGESFGHRSLRAVAEADSSALLALLSHPLVYEYLNDGAAPSLPMVDDWISEALEGSAPLGLWVLEDPELQLPGCVRLAPVPDEPTTAEITFVLHPSLWGRGLATAMSQSIMSQAFASGRCDAIIAGADSPNHRSFAVMRRLGMAFFRNTHYPAGPGREFKITRSQYLATQ